MRLEAEGLSYAYPRRALCLQGVSAAIESGEIAFILGANGSGKTTLLACFAGTLRPTEGTVSVDGFPLRAFSPRERAKRIGVVPQLHDSAVIFSVEDMVGLGRVPYVGLFSQPGRDDRLAVARALDAVGLTSLRRQSMSRVSGGERQLAWIARGLAQGAACLLLDEPTAHLDPQHEHSVFAVVRRLAEDGAAFFITSHHPETAFLYAVHVTFLQNGRVLASGPPLETITPDTLSKAYGIDFHIITSGDGESAVVPHLRRDEADPRGA